MVSLQFTNVCKDGTLQYFRIDCKTQVSVEYEEEGKQVRLEAVVANKVEVNSLIHKVCDNENNNHT